MTSDPEPEYYVIHPDGSRYGPADLKTLNQWASQGRILPLTTVVMPDGKELEAREVPYLEDFPLRYKTPLQRIALAANEFWASVIMALFAAACLGPIALLGIWFAFQAKKKGHPFWSIALGANVLAILVYALNQFVFRQGGPIGPPIQPQG